MVLVVGDEREVRVLRQKSLTSNGDCDLVVVVSVCGRDLSSL